MRFTSRDWRPVALAAVVALALPAVFVGNALLLLVHPWLVDAQYALPGFPEPYIDLASDQRSGLAGTGVRAISPWNGDGVELLRDARLPGGEPAFDSREVAHMSDVRAVVAGFMVAWMIGVVALTGSVIALHRAGAGALLWRGLGWGAGATLAAFAALGLYMLADFDAFFTSFHGVFFEGDSWRFASDDTLLSLYPDQFWGFAAGAAAVLILLQAVGALLASRRRSSRPAETHRGGT